MLVVVHVSAIVFSNLVVLVVVAHRSFVPQSVVVAFVAVRLGSGPQSVVVAFVAVRLGSGSAERPLILGARTKDGAFAGSWKEDGVHASACIDWMVACPRSWSSLLMHFRPSLLVVLVFLVVVGRRSWCSPCRG